jgi:hypothetical protein
VEQTAYQGISVTLIRTFGWILIVLIGLAVYARLAKKEYPERTLPGGTKNPVIALELVKSKDEIKMTLGEDGDESSETMRGMLRKDVKGDSFVFIPLYWALIMAMSWLLTRRQIDGAFWMGIVAGACITGAAIFDYMENSGMSTALDTSIARTTDQMAAAIRNPSLAKWALIFIAMGLLSALFWRQNWIVAIAVIYLLIGIIGMIGLIYHQAIEWAFTLMAVSMILVALLFAFWPKQFLDRF